MILADSAILVTGAGSGIGRRLTERLSMLGHRTFATARNERDLDSLRELPHVSPVALDLRDPAQIARAAEEVAASGVGLRGLVNNAGVGGIGPIAAWTDSELEEIFAVNALAPVRMSRAFLPLLLESKGRIVNVGSQGGSISKKYFGPYTMTKHALEAFTIALDEEVAPFWMRASIVQPGGVATAIGAKSIVGDLGRFRRAPAPFDVEGRAIAEALGAAASARAEEDRREDRAGDRESEGDREDRAGHSESEQDRSDRDDEQAPEGTRDDRADEPESEENRKPSSPDLVCDAILHALFDPEPRRRYLVGTRWEGNRVVGTLFERLADANDCPALRYSRDELVAWLDRALGRR